MYELLTQAAGLHAIHWGAHPAGGAYAGPERRTEAGPLARWYELMLDEIDYGVLLLDEDGEVLHVNHTARAELDEHHPLQLCGPELRARRARDVAILQEALYGAGQRGLRRLIMLGDGDHRVAVSVVPLRLHGDPRYTSIQVSMGKRQVCGELSVQWFARSHRLTQAETRVLEALCEGVQPTDIAERHGVGISTIRTQIGSIRAKTRSDSIGSLVRQVAVLPPLVGVLRAGGRTQEAPLQALPA
jgi:DNA-binding CsgD family transcriptional regulator